MPRKTLSLVVLLSGVLTAAELYAIDNDDPAPVFLRGDANGDGSRDPC